MYATLSNWLSQIFNLVHHRGVKLMIALDTAMVLGDTYINKEGIMGGWNVT